MDTPAATDTLLFGPFRFDRSGRGLARLDDSGLYQPVNVGSRALDVLAALLTRRGELVSKSELMSGVWPGTTVDEHNLAVQISSLRRVLDEGRSGPSCIQTVAGRGYRFLGSVERFQEPRSSREIASTSEAGAVAAGPMRQPRWPWRWIIATSAGIIIVLAIMAFWPDARWASKPETPRLSIVVLPFQNLSGDRTEDYLADSITDDLTTDLSRIPEAFVVARESAYSYQGHATDVRRIGQELGVRYVLEGSVRKLGAVLRVNVQLISAENGLHLWADRFDEELRDLADGQQRVLARMRGALGISLVDIERARSQHERPGNPDAVDLVLRARSLRNQPVTPARTAEALALYERALLLDPGSHLAMAGAAYLLIDEYMDLGYWVSSETKERAEELTARALEIAPMAEDALRANVYLLRTQGRWRDAIAAAHRMIEMFPNVQTGYVILGLCETFTGNPAAEIALNETLLRLSPRSPHVFNFHRRIGVASLMLGRDEDAITFLERSLALHPDASVNFRQSTIRQMAAAHARLGHDELARRALAEANRLWPFDTVRGHSPLDPGSAVAAEQIRAYQDGLRRAGLRDHADEDADFSIQPDSTLRSNRIGYTPTTTPGASTIRSADLPVFIAERRPLIIDVLTFFWGRSIPGAIGLKNGGIAGTFSDGVQDRLKRKMAELTGGDLSKPIVAVGWNSERFDGRNLALRLVALGYTNVYWYRGGREAWEVAGMPETELVPHEW